jgi:diadenosine tetraphosphatase ApaH/serine/threonine PP2A family protein phosphatase
VRWLSVGLSRLFNRERSLPTTATGERIYAIGDVHGRLDLLRRLITQLGADANTPRKCSARIVFLGDLIDRGPHSREVLEFVRRMHSKNPDRVTLLCGNHEDMMLASANGHAAAQKLWLANGGDATLRSYGLNPAEFMDLAPSERGAAITRAVGADMLDWLGALPLADRSGDYFFCHAGVRPGLPLNMQRREDLLWIRGEFTNSEEKHGAVIVHGHSERDEVQVTSNRINVDTSAYRSGNLTAVGLQGPLRWFVSTAERYWNRSDLAAASGRPT